MAQGVGLQRNVGWDGGRALQLRGHRLERFAASADERNLDPGLGQLPRDRRADDRRRRR